MANQNLTSAKKSKNDEFYTRWEEIEKDGRFEKVYQRILIKRIK
jgi:hypothetical protein